MNILSISGYNSSNIYKKNNLLNNKKESTNISVQLPIQSTQPLLHKNYFLSFKGGDSLNLAQTMKNFEEFESNGAKKIVPERVAQEAYSIIQNGNPDDMTLIDVHKRVYEDLKYAESLDEAKSLYPEFSDVLSVDDVAVQNNSFINAVKQGNNEYFSKDEDLALQLLKLYWAEGFSTNDLKGFSHGDNLAYAMKKLNIPMLNRHYAIVLKFSDKEYNERITEEMSSRRMENIERKSGNTGYVYIPRGKMPEDQKKKISESLIQYYINNPQRVYAQSLRQKEFYKNNPEASELLSQVLNEAWKLGSSKPVRDALNNFFRCKHSQNCMKELSDVNNMSSKMRVLMQEFWDTNPHAKEKFSVSMKCAWKRVRELDAMEKSKIVMPIQQFPFAIQQKIYSWAKEKGYDTSKLNFNVSAFAGSEKAVQRLSGSRMISEYFNKNELMADIYGDSLACTFAALRDYLYAFQKDSRGGNEIIQMLERGAKGKKIMSTADLVNVYCEIVSTLIRGNNPAILYKLGKFLDCSYYSVISMRKTFGLPVPKD